MSLTRSGNFKLSSEEWNELIALKEAINFHPQSVSSYQMEKFTELMVRSLSGKGDPFPFDSQNQFHYSNSNSNSMPTIDDHIQSNQDLLKTNLSPQSRLHYENELKQLKNYRNNHSEDTHDPSSLELYCEENPDSLECRIHDH